jgi:hypothetical protein
VHDWFFIDLSLLLFDHGFDERLDDFWDVLDKGYEENGGHLILEGAEAVRLAWADGAEVEVLEVTVHEGDDEEGVEGVDEHEDKNLGDEGVLVGRKNLMVLEVVEAHTELGINGVEDLNLDGVKDGGHLVYDESVSVNAVAVIEVILQKEDAQHAGNDHAYDKKADGQR